MEFPSADSALLHWELLVKQASNKQIVDDERLTRRSGVVPKRKRTERLTRVHDAACRVHNGLEHQLHGQLVR
jgi:hypothetical protein